MLICLCAALLPAQSVTLAWDASPDAGVTGYRIYCGTNSRSYGWSTNVGLVLTQTVVLPYPARCYLAATALDAYGAESDYSNEVIIGGKPVAPVLHGESWVRLVPMFSRSTNLVDWSPFAGEPTWLPASQPQEFFKFDRLAIAPAQ
jgi:hypothetical protein